MYDKIIAVAIFIIVYVLMISERVHRTIAVILGAVLMVGFGILDGHHVVEYIHWEALGLIFGMFILVAALSESGFFRWVGLETLKLTKFNVFYVFIFFCVLAGFLAAFMDSITVMIFMASLTVEICLILKMPPIPFLIAEICSANIGGSATMVGDPPNIIIGTSLNFSFMDFVTHTGPIAVMVFLINITLFYFWYKKIFVGGKKDLEKIYHEHKELEPFNAIKDLRLMRISLAVFVFTVTLLVLHQILDLLIAFVGILGGTLVLLFGGKKMPGLVEKIDWHTILFLAGLFVMVGGLEQVGILSDIASGIASVSNGNIIITVTLILWVSAICSSVLDNVPFAAAMVPVLRNLEATGLPLPAMAWSLALGADIGGNATPIGASANVVGLAVAEKHGVTISWKEYCKVAYPIMIICIIAINILIYFLISSGIW